MERREERSHMQYNFLSDLKPNASAGGTAATEKAFASPPPRCPRPQTALR